MAKRKTPAAGIVAVDAPQQNTALTPTFNMSVPAQIIIDEPIVLNKEVVEVPVVGDSEVFTHEVVEVQVTVFNPHNQETCELSTLLPTEGTLENLLSNQAEQSAPLDVSVIGDYPEKFIQKQIFPLYERLGVDTSNAVYFVHGSKQSAARDQPIKIRVRTSDQIDLFIGYSLLDQLRAKLS